MRVVRLFLPALVLAMTTAPAAVVLTAQPAAAVTVSPAAFSPALALNNAEGASTGGSEPSIQIDSKDNIYVSAPAGVPTGGCPFWYVHSDGTSYDYRGTIDTEQGSVGGGDCDISTTPATGAFDDVSVTSLSLANLTSNVTTDGGVTWRTIANSASQQIFGVDRQWQAADPGLDRHYLTVHDLATSNIQVSVSTDGGYQYLQNAPAIDATTNHQALQTGVLVVGGVSGHNHFGALVVDPTTHKLYIPFLAPVPGDNAQAAEHGLFIAEGDPCQPVACTPGQPAGPITWTNHLAFAAPAADNLSNDFPALTMGTDGTLYAAFTGAVTKPASATASDVYSKSRIFVLHGTTPHSSAAWSAPQAVDPGTGNANVFPWLVAGSAGNVGVAWYASRLEGTTCPGAGTAGNGTSVSDNCLNVWNVAYAQSADGNTASPTWAVSDVSGTVHKGPICNQGLSCDDGTRTMLDFFDVAIDSVGRPNIAYVSDTRSLNTADVQFTRQCSGTTLTGSAISDCISGGGTGGTTGTTGGGVVPNCLSPQMTDPAGDATALLVADPGQSGVNQADLDITDAGVSWDAAGDALVEVIHVSDLSALPGNSESLVYNFTLNNTAYELDAERDDTGQASFVWRKPGIQVVPLGPVTGSFDTTKSEIRVVLPADSYASGQPALPALGPGSVITDMSVTANRLFGASGPAGTPVEGVGASYSPTADSATAPAACAFVISTDPIVAEVPVAVLLPMVGLAVFGVLYLRRRRRVVA